jgi:predicted permease
MFPLRTELSLVSRKFLRNPGFTLVAILTLALGIGASTAIFSLVHGVLLEPLPYPRSEQLYGLWHSAPGIGIPELEQSNTTYTVYRNFGQSFEEIGLTEGPYSHNLTGIGEPVHVDVAGATASLFEVLGVSAILGRTFSEEEDAPGAPQVALLSHAFWRGRLGGAADVLGRTIELDGTPWEVVGVMPEGFTYPGETTSLWIPYVIKPEDLGQVSFSYEAVGRLKPDVTVEAATRELNQLLKRAPEIYPGEMTAGILESAQMSAYLTPMLEDVVGDVGAVLWTLLGAVMVVLLIACANLANLFLVRAEGRQRELALRTALGASRAAALQHFLTESLLLSTLGGIVGVAMAYAALRGLVALSPDTIPRLDEVGIHPAVLLFAGAVSLVSGILFGIIPVVRYRRPNLLGAINEGSLRASAGRETHRARSALVVAQVALALVLLIGSALMARSFWELRHVHPGFEADSILTVRLSLTDAAYPEPQDSASFYRRLMESLEALPGVERASAVSRLPMIDRHPHNAVSLEDYPVKADEVPPIVATNWATPGYFETFGIPLLEGRTFERRDHEQRTDAVVVSRSFAEQFWPNGSALGKRLVPGLPGNDSPWYTIVGVVGDVLEEGLEHAPKPMMYHAVMGQGGEYGDWNIQTMTVILRTEVPPATLTAAVRDKVWALDPNLPLIRILTGEEILSEATARTSYTMILIAIAAGVALFLGLIGIYGVISYIVNQRTREIGVRMALGADRRDVSGMVVRQGLRMTVAGVVLGIGGALLATRLISALLFGVESADPWTFALVPLFLVSIATLASYVPARRAASLSPVESLRHQ